MKDRYRSVYKSRVMAAGIGSHYGGIKQIEAVGPSCEILLDYSVYDALRGESRGAQPMLSSSSFNCLAPGLGRTSQTLARLPVSLI